MLKVILVSATNFECLKTIDYLEKNFEQKSFTEFTTSTISISPFVMGIGLAQSSFALGRHKNLKDYDLLIHIGISGVYRPEKYKLGDLIEITHERFADIGAEEKDGSLIDLFDLDFLPKNQFPYNEKWISNPTKKWISKYPKAKGLTVSKASGNADTITKLLPLNADVESMEGAALFYACRCIDIPFISLRAISNYVEPRNKDRWNVPLALENLNDALIQMIKNLNETQSL